MIMVKILEYQRLQQQQQQQQIKSMIIIGIPYKKRKTTYILSLSDGHWQNPIKTLSIIHLPDMQSLFLQQVSPSSNS